MPTQNVNLTDTLDAFVKEQVSLGYYNNASEVHRAALAAMAQREEERQLLLQRLRHEIQQGIDDVEAGHSVKISSSDSLKTMMDGCMKNAMERLDQANAEPLT